MRVNLYEEELTNEAEVVSTTTEEGRTFYGARLFLRSSDALHHSAEDDDRSAVTFWVNNQQRAQMLADHFRRDLEWTTRNV
jgi:hypothetical protein